MFRWQRLVDISFSQSAGEAFSELSYKHFQPVPMFMSRCKLVQASLYTSFCRHDPVSPPQKNIPNTYSSFGCLKPPVG
jgi:hypothetical protein